jgi:TonB family protein
VSSVPVRPTPAPATTERRSHPRKRLDQLAYIGFGPDIGGVLLDISEEGLRCQIVGPVVEGDRCHVKFALPGRRSAIEVDGEVVWSNSSRQGGGIRLVGLRPEERQNLQQWIHDEITASGVKRRSRIPILTKSVGAVDMPQPSAHVPAVPSAAAEEKPAPPMRKLQPPVVFTPKAPAIAPTSAAGAARKTAAAKERDLQPKGTTPFAHLSLLPVQDRSSRSTKITVLAGCIIAGVAALVFSGLNPAILLSGRTILASASPGIIAAPAPPAMPTLNSPAPAAPPDESASPTVASDAPEPDSRSTRPAAPITTRAPANLPPQSPQAAEPANRQPLALALQRPRATSSALAAVATIEAPVTPAAPLMDMQEFGSRSPEVPQPARPQAISDYRAPRMISQVEPVYSALARQQGLQGTVKVNVTIGADGVPRSWVCVDGNTILCRMATDVIAKWRYQPATSNGLPVVAQMVVSFSFQLR